VKIESWVRRRLDTMAIKVTEGVFTYVRVGSDGRPKPVADPPDA
jgi:acyl-CoA thioesterase YciA